MPARWQSFAFDLGNEKKVYFCFLHKFDISYPQRAGYPSLPQEFRSPEMILNKRIPLFCVCSWESKLFDSKYVMYHFVNFLHQGQRLDRPLSFLDNMLVTQNHFLLCKLTEVKLTDCQEGPLTWGKFVINWCMLAFLAAAMTSSIGTSLVLSP